MNKTLFALKKLKYHAIMYIFILMIHLNKNENQMINFEVIIKSRDRPEYLQKCLDSVLNQTVKFDLVIISDNSLNNSFTKKIEKKR